MDNQTLNLMGAFFLGIGATITFDLWARFLKYAFGITPSNICLVGRWIRYMPEGTFRHTYISSSPRRSWECTVGWIAHYSIGTFFAVMFVALVGNEWLKHPTLLPPIVFGFVTVLAPFFIMQPFFGLGFAGSKTPDPAQARLRTLMNHAAFGVGLYLFAVLLSWLSGAHR